MRYARIPFSLMSLQYSGGIEIDLFSQMLKQLPHDAKIIGFGEVQTSMTSYVFVSSSSFKDTPDGSLPPDITPSFKRDYVGNLRCDHVDCSAALDLSVPSSFAPYGSNNSVLPTQQAPTRTCYAHNWKMYHGFNDSYEICATCGVRKP